MEINRPPLNPLSYQLRKGITSFERNGSPVLVLDYPLKVVVLKPFWRSVLDLLLQNKSVLFQDIISLLDAAELISIRKFLDQLVHKGFLERKGTFALSEFPLVSVIIPVRNRPGEIRECLNSLAAVNYPPDKLEVIVIDDASTDQTRAVISEFPVRLVSLKQRRQASYCRNAGVKEAKGELLAFIDSDCLAAPNWLRELVPAFADQSVGGVGGLVDGCFQESALDRYELTKSSLNMGKHFKRSQANNLFFYVPSCNLLVRRELFTRLQGFEEELTVGEDVDLCWRMQDMGFELEYWPVGTVYHKHRNQLRPFCTRRFDYGTSEPILQKKHRTRRKSLYFIPTATIFGAAAIILAGFSHLSWLPICLLIPLVEALLKKKLLKKQELPLGFFEVLIAVCRVYVSFFYHLCAFISRYYLGGALILAPLFPIAGATMMGMHLFTGIVDYFTKRPPLNLIGFLFFFTLEQLSYQTGVWWAAFKTHCFLPLKPRVFGQKSV
ncbi:MAG: mycofactocin biosynthesis glycosyltransferase MftF [SAR324 cluster bacterium]|nr:mycofactocin biosynthesis glycosyltransferase MftF [SAR324 cluster bacterium]